MNAVELHRLTNIGKALVDDEFLESFKETQITDSHAWEPIELQISITPLQPIIKEVIQTSIEKPFKTDSRLARALHRNLNLPRRYAMDTRIWHYLTCISYPEYVRFRWTRNNNKVSKERFLGGIKRNALARLWWAAEVLHNEDDYSLVNVCFDNQDLYEAVFGRSLSKFPPAAKVFVHTVKEETRIVIRDSAKVVNLLLSTFVLEDLTDLYFQSLIQSQIEALSS